MATLTIRNLDAALKERLRVRAAQHGHSIEAEVREILQQTLKEPERPEVDLYQRIRRRFAPLGGVDLDLPPREPAREPPQLGERELEQVQSPEAGPAPLGSEAAAAVKSRAGTGRAKSPGPKATSPAGGRRRR